MTVQCVRVEREAGERTRQQLAERDLIAEEYDIVVEDGWLYVPVSDPEAVPADMTIVEYDAPVRETATMPADLLNFDPSYERIGKVAIIDEDDPNRARDLADAIVDSDLPVDTVLNRASKIKGQTRVRDWEILAGDSTEVTHREYGCEFHLDLAAVYFSPRLATERHRVVEQVEAASVDADYAGGEQVVDMFAGVGPFAIPMAKVGATVLAVDVNERAIEYLCENATRNDVEDRITPVAADVREVAPEYAGWADRLVMNLPHSADEFLDAAATFASAECILHYYDIQHEDDPFGPGEAAIREAFEPDYQVTVETRHVVRSYAPHELNVVLDVRVER